ncbi:hypothetical protein Agabi119p4_7834 [Agaricus bisporus var. burnettii]|uniref:Uncharacterized protein n=1 Tax=Agaricus bisporus var. burnettii TaxID=192524 RepID=A0A8H7EZF2_AGABI|nr:hypothetical protein Agabi119p4_7834 [Agaricus bisporus var. burnettii]
MSYETCQQGSKFTVHGAQSQSRSTKLKKMLWSFIYPRYSSSGETLDELGSSIALDFGEIDATPPGNKARAFFHGLDSHRPSKVKIYHERAFGESGKKMIGTCIRGNDCDY